MRQKAVAYSAMAAVVIVALVTPIDRQINRDVAYFLGVAKNVASGQRLYLDFLDHNAPMNVWLGLVSLAVATRTTLPLPLVHLYAILILLFVSIVTTCAILRSNGVQLATRTLCFCCLTLLFFRFVGAEFGQREHLFAALTLPLVAVRGSRILKRRIGVWTSAASIALALVGTALKPNFLLFPVALLFARRPTRHQLSLKYWLRDESFCVVVALAAGWAVTDLIYPTYFREVLPDALAMTAVTRVSPLELLAPDVIAVAFAVAVIVLGSVVLHWELSREGVDRAARWELQMLVVAVFLVMGSEYALQGMGFPYHLVPFQFYALLFVGVVLWSVSSRLRTRLSQTNTDRAILIACVVVTAVGWAVSRPIERLRKSPSTERPEFAVYVAGLQADRILALSPSVRPLSPSHLFFAAEQVGGFYALPLVPGVILGRQEAGQLAAKDLERLNRIEEKIRSLIRIGLDRQPDVVFIDERKPMRFLEKIDPEGTIDFLEWLNRDRVFKESLARCYTQSATVRVPNELLVYRHTCD